MKPECFPGLRYVRADDGPLVQATTALEYGVFADYGYSGAGPVLAEYEGYPSVIYAAVSADEGVVGMVRRILPGPSGIPTIDSLQVDFSNPTVRSAVGAMSTCEDLASTVVKKGYRAKYSFACVLNLWRLAFQDAIRSGARYWFAAIEPVILWHYRNTFHIDLGEIGPPQDYLGALCTPCILDLKEAIERLYAEDAELAAWLEQTTEDAQTSSKEVVALPEAASFTGRRRVTVRSCR